MHEKHYRSIVKGVSYRILGTLTTIIISYVAIGKVGMALSIGVADVIVKVGIYYVHERVWNKIPLGLVRQQTNDYQI